MPGGGALVTAMLRTVAPLLLTAGLIAALPAFGQSEAEQAALPYVEAVRQSVDGTLDHEIAIAAIAEFPDAAAPAFMPWFERNAHSMPTDYLYAYADRRFAEDQVAGAAWFMAARLKRLYDALRCTDGSVIQQIALIDAAKENIVVFLQTNPEDARRAGEWALAWDAAVDFPYREEELVKFCATGIRGWEVAIEQGLLDKSAPAPGGEGDFGETRIVPLPEIANPAAWILPPSTHPQARADARKITGRVIERLSAAPEKSGTPE